MTLTVALQEVDDMSREETGDPSTDTVSKASRPRGHVTIFGTWCKGCGICVAFCPHNVLDMDDHEIAVVTNLDNCNSCGLCERRCPDMAIEVISE